MKDYLVLVLIGSESDREIMQPSSETLSLLGIPFRMEVASAHRNPEKVRNIVKEAEDAGVEVIIAGAGMSAALPGFVASLTSLPVIGVPISSGLPGGIDALFSMVQMPSGIPVATVSIDGARNAAILAGRILGLRHPDVRAKLSDLKRKLEEA
ncbi:MAG: 5-(carboxyamino)imidazole ribonucleotide mutase [Actinomycetota bacterium]|nr:5-(carboxyamino)imidazole ribonucleotide mutase [Actinomycetota bacterium]